MPRPYDPRSVPPISLRDEPRAAIRALCANRPDVVAEAPKGVEQLRYQWPNGSMVLIYPQSIVVAGSDRAAMEATAEEIRTAIRQNDPSIQCPCAATDPCVTCGGAICRRCDAGHTPSCHHP